MNEPDTPTDDELRGERDELLDALARMPADDPHAPACCAHTGRISYALYLRHREPEDLELAREAFELAFRRPGDDGDWHMWRIQYGHVLAFGYDEEPTAERLDEVMELALTGVGGLPPDDEEYTAVRAVGVHLLALGAKARYEARADDGEREGLLGEALRWHEEALAVFGPGTAEAVDLREALGHLYLERCMVRDSMDDAAVSAGHFRAVLEAALPGTDLPFVRCGLGIALMLHGRAGRDRDELEEARDAFGRAVAEARRGGGPEPEWVWEAQVRGVFIRAMIWATWHDQGHAAAAETELKALLAVEGALDRLMPQYLDVFGRLLYERAAARHDAPGRDRALALMRRAVAEWRPERDGSVTAAAFCLASFQQIRHQEDPDDPQRLQDVARGAALALQDEGLDPDLRNGARLMAHWARQRMEERGIEPAAGDLPEGLGFEETRRMYLEMLQAIQEGRLFFDLDTDYGFPGMSGEITDANRLARGFDALYENWCELEEGSRERSQGAAMLLTHLPFFDPHGDRVDEERRTELMRALLRPGDEDDPAWRSKAHAVAGAVRMREEMAGTGARMDEVMAHFAEARTTASADGGMPEGDLDFVTLVARTHRGQTAGATDDVEAGIDDWRRIRDDPRITPHVRLLMDAQQASHEAHLAARRGDLATVDARIALMLEVHGGLDPEDPSRVELWTAIENSRVTRDDLARRLGAPAAPPLPGRPTAARLRKDAARLPRDHRAWVLGDGGLTRFVGAVGRQDPAGIAEAMELVREAHGLVDKGSDSWLRYTNCLGAGHCALASAQRDRRARDTHLEQGIALLEEANAAVTGPEHRLHASVRLGLGRAYRMRGSLYRGDREAGRRNGLEALRGHAWAALLQSGTDHAAEAAAEATGTALEVAGWCLRDNVPEEAVTALDSCRGLVLHAATTSMTVPERLVAAGREDLADEWRTVAGTDPATDPLAAVREPMSVPSELRRRVLAVLTGEGALQGRLLEPPEPGEIGGALRAVGKDALVYLVPASEESGGTAVVVTSSGEVHAVPLPTLNEQAAPLRDYLPEPGGARDMGPVTDAPAARVPELRAQLDRLCGWAWYAGIRPLFDAFAAPSRPGRVPRLVLVPMGRLGLVPWHAAWEPAGGGRRRYALQEAEISYAASARLLCEVAARPSAHPGPGRDGALRDGAALIVGNPTGDLRFAGEEADAVQRVFYPDGQFLGRRDGGQVAGAGTPREVVSWLRGGAADGGVLHLACHATVAEKARRSAYLSLYGGELSAEELTEAVGGGARGSLGLVLLAACRSHVSGRGHNEAYSLATAFMVAGARSVIGSLWPVPDDATSVLMFMVHHYLRREGEPPAKALRRAQLWMLDPARELPAELPPLLAERAGRVDPDDLSAWAGFTHLGQ
ncbi:CHAT domain-containing protein [Streptomyces sp. NPDC049837]|uniref:CHAT domain-containing protein n=1 Tax=Streptomyces sp. NPDC049837 TaxID=3155277 RepID=UPI00342FADD0